MRAAGFGRWVLDLLFPQRCVWCGRVQGFKADCSCGGVPEDLRLPNAALPPTGPDIPWVLNGAWACFAYTGTVRDALLRFKFEDEPHAAQAFGDELAARCQNSGLAGRYDLIVPVPVSAKTKRRRGYNQSRLLAAVLSRRAGLPYSAAALQKRRETTPQRELDRAGRLTNLKGAYIAEPEQIAGKRVLLVDDILTTGSTLNECAATLLAAGARACGALCLAATPAPGGAAGAAKEGETNE